MRLLSGANFVLACVSLHQCTYQGVCKTMVIGLLPSPYLVRILHTNHLHQKYSLIVVRIKLGISEEQRAVQCKQQAVKTCLQCIRYSRQWQDHHHHQCSISSRPAQHIQPPLYKQLKPLLPSLQWLPFLPETKLAFLPTYPYFVTIGQILH